MKCENVYCIYNSEEICIIADEDLELDIQGKCMSCIYVDIESDELRRLKEKQLKAD